MPQRPKDLFDTSMDIDVPQAPAPRSALLTMRLAPDEVSALEAMAGRLGVGKSTLARIFLRQGLGLGRSTR